VVDIPRDMNPTCRSSERSQNSSVSRGTYAHRRFLRKLWGRGKFTCRLSEIPAGDWPRHTSTKDTKPLSISLAGNPVCGTATTWSSTLSLAPETLSISSRYASPAYNVSDVEKLRRTHCPNRPQRSGKASFYSRT